MNNKNSEKRSVIQGFVQFLEELVAFLDYFFIPAVAVVIDSFSGLYSVVPLVIAVLDQVLGGI